MLCLWIDVSINSLQVPTDFLQIVEVVPIQVVRRIVVVHPILAVHHILHQILVVHRSLVVQILHPSFGC